MLTLKVQGLSNQMWGVKKKECNFLGFAVL